MKVKPKYKVRVCEVCGCSYTPTQSRQRFCTEQCYNKYANIKYKNYKSEWCKDNRDRQNESSRLWTKLNPEKRKLACDKYRKEHKEYYALYVRLRKNNKKRACPPWADLEEIKCIYQEAAYFQLEVDHIIPLKHKLVCGLHIPDNLQLLSRSANAQKSNIFNQDVDILGVVTDE